MKVAKAARVAPALIAGLVALLSFAVVQAGTTIVGKVVGIQDGDTVTVLDMDLTQHRLRLAGIDAPERGQAFGHASMESLSALCFGRLVTAICHKVDQYGRQVCTIMVDGKDVNLAQVSAGLAWHYKRFAHEQSAQEREAYEQAEETARAEKIGLWRDPHPIAPWDWRSFRRTNPRAQ